MDRLAMPLYKRKPGGVWWVRIGRKTRKSTGTKDRQRAQEFERVLQQRLWRRNKLGDRGALSWNKAVERWLKDSKRARTRDREFIQWLKPRIGEDAISDVADPAALDQLREDGLQEGWAPSTVDRMMRTVRSVLRSCWKRKEIEQPYVPMHGDPEPEPRFLTEPQFRALCRELPLHLELAAKFAVTSLLRKTPHTRLTWDRVDIEKRWLWVPGEKTKTGKPFGISLSDEAIEILRECSRWFPTGERVFQYDHKPIANFRTGAFLKAARRAGVPDLRWHDLRHTGASWAVQSGVTLQELMVLGNWKSYRSVLIYAHLAPSNSSRAAQLVGQTLAHALKQTG
jgi:integrase